MDTLGVLLHLDHLIDDNTRDRLADLATVPVEDLLECRTLIASAAAQVIPEEATEDDIELLSHLKAASVMVAGEFRRRCHRRPQGGNQAVGGEHQQRGRSTPAG